MTDDRVWQLLEELLDSEATPEEICGSCPELLPELRARWREVCQVRDELDALLPAQMADIAPALPPATALPQVPGYEVDALLGCGGMGVVFRARHERLNRTVALKMMIAGEYAGTRERERFQREAEAVAALRHPNVVQIYDVGEAAGRPYFTMEFVEGGSLAQRLAGAPQPAHHAARLVATLAEAVHVAHRSGIVHRDLKPANVLMDKDGNPKVGDFGLARRLDGAPTLTRTGTVAGTASYMAPEQARGRTNEVGTAADIYALGAILHELLTGRPPFRAESEAETLQQVIAQDSVPPSRLNAKVPRDLDTICLKCLHKEPHIRYATATALAEDLGRFMRGEAIAARPERWVGRLVRRVRHRPLFSAAAAAGGLFAIILVAGGLWLISDRAAAAREIQAERAATERAAEEDLREMAQHLRESSWPEATAARERAKGRLGDRGSAELRRLLDLGTRDLELAARLDAIRLNDFESADARYEDAFREAGLGQVHDDTVTVAARISNSNIRAALVTALDHWSSLVSDPRRKSWVLEVARMADSDPTGWRVRARDPEVRKNNALLEEFLKTAPIADQPVSLLLALELNLSATSPEHLPFLGRLQRAHPGDFWVNYRLGSVLDEISRPGDAIGYFRAAVAARPEAAHARNNLGMVLLKTGRQAEAVEEFRQAVRFYPASGVIRLNFCVGLFNLRQFDEALEQLPEAIRLNPNAAILRTAFGLCLESKGQHDEALARHREAVALEPKRLESQRELRAFLMRRGRMTDARAAWQAAIEANPLDHETRYGYAEFCVFIGEEDQYRLARQMLLKQFSAATNPYVAERTARACLLRPASADELRQAAVLAERAAAADRAKYPPGAFPYFLFVRGLAEYRQGQFDRAISTMRGDAGRAPGPAPGLVLAMALYQSGNIKEARKTLEAVIRSHDWSTDQARDQDGWIAHVLRREAEALIMPSRTGNRATDIRVRGEDAEDAGKVWSMRS
jgi:eukaryotic-like serine/threonine-protein kinase